MQETPRATLFMPILSQWSFQYDVAIDVVAYGIIEEATDVVNYGVGTIGRLFPWSGR